MAEILIIAFVSGLIYFAFRKKKESAAAQHKFSDPNAKTDKTQSWPSRDNPKSFTDQLREPDIWEANKDIIKGFTLSVTLDLDTPYQYILEASIVYDNPHDIPDIPGRYGVWIPYLGETSIEGTRASHFGPVTDTYAEQVLLPFLAEYRKIIESPDTPEKKKSALDALGHKVDIWKKYIGIRRFGNPQSLGELWALRNLLGIKGIGPAKARKLIGQEIYTIEQYEKEGL